MKEYIEREAALLAACVRCNHDFSDEPCEPADCYIQSRIYDIPAADVVELPCKIGDEVWAIKNFSGVKHPKKGIVSEMFFRQDMKLMIVVSYVARGLWMETIFPTYEDAVAALAERKEA